jgi:uncharacterized protein YacL
MWKQMFPNLGLLILRVIFLVFAGALSVFVISRETALATSPFKQFLIFGGLMALGVVVIALDMAFKDKDLSAISAVYFGLIVGLFLTYVAGLALTPFLDLLSPPRSADQPAPPLHSAVQLVVGMVLCYICISLLLQTRHDFRFIIPYVEFSKEIKGHTPYVLDTSVVIDGRIADVVETKVIDSQLIMPRFVLTELQAIADSSDRLKRSRGRRGLDILNRLRSNPEVDLQIHDRDLPEYAGQSVDLKLVLLAKHLGGKVVTNDYNLNKVARLHGVGVVNLNDVANALKPVFLPGETVTVTIVKPGEEPGQGVGYLDDGTMVVVESGRDYLHRSVTINVTSVLQTSAGRMIFGKFERVAAGVA